MENFIIGAVVALVSVAFGFVGCFFLCNKGVIHTGGGVDTDNNNSDEHFKTDSGLLTYKKRIPDEE